MKSAIIIVFSFFLFSCTSSQKNIHSIDVKKEQEARLQENKKNEAIAEIERKIYLLEQETKYYANQREAQSADCGPYPTNYVHLVKNSMKDILKDPFSAKYSFDKPFKTYTLTDDKTKIFCWRIDVRINAKNAFGGYAGYQPWAFYVRDGHIIEVLQ